MRQWIIILSGLLTATMLTGCFFTGIESTPRITAKDVRRQGAAMTPEQQFAATISPIPFNQWQKGDLRVVTSDRFTLIAGSNCDAGAGDTLRYESFYPQPTITGDTATVICFSNLSNNRQVTVRLDHSPAQLAARNVTEIPFTVDLRLVALADSLLSGNEYYILTPMRVKPDGTSETGAKFRPVHIDRVMAGDDNYPLQLILTDETGHQTGVIMTAGPERTATRNFDRLFSFTDPKLRYPSITDDRWRLICNGKLIVGMTRDEARLSVGTPADIKKSNDGTSYFETWTYDNGSYLIFVDGLLDSFRK